MTTPETPTLSAMPQTSENEQTLSLLMFYRSVHCEYDGNNRAHEGRRRTRHVPCVLMNELSVCTLGPRHRGRGARRDRLARPSFLAYVHFYVDTNGNIKTAKRMWRGNSVTSDLLFIKFSERNNDTNSIECFEPYEMQFRNPYLHSVRALTYLKNTFPELSGIGLFQSSIAKINFHQK
ncbi:hypothetical protein EVAR_41822_1 [Eumeta japonica]|uniref:Uncharacterized protein n=1 Tax=Eumeta variegata TaxID=151549 RepID=A0A4C1XAE0_EUMVA|nr:hypothetical protein EVAR_41822_1 [Eumeta japonica]